jgi:hypothetical protein
MKNCSGPRRKVISLAVITCLFAVTPASAQASYERVFTQSKAAVEKALKTLQSSLAGHLPVLEGFAKPGEHPLDRYQRGYYQTTVQIMATAPGGSLVRVSAKVTAWYSDAVASRSGYQLLTSNGRLEADLLDQLAEQLAAEQPAVEPVVKAAPKPAQKSEPGSMVHSAAPASAEATPLISAPEPTKSAADFSSASQSLPAEERASGQVPGPASTGKTDSALQAEAESLEQILKNQAHPNNIVAVKKSGTAVVGSPSLTAKPLFLASMHDEFEMLDFNRDWVHVRISGLSRGWIWRNGVELPEGIPDTDVASGPAPAPAADLFHVVREENSQFPGDWELLRGKNVKILSVQKVDENAKNAGPKERLEYAKLLLAQNYSEIAQKSPALAGIVLIFDSVDGGMIAATLTTLQQWKAGKLSDSALWHNCFFDPPETFDSNGPSGSQ